MAAQASPITPLRPDMTCDESQYEMDKQTVDANVESECPDIDRKRVRDHITNESADVDVPVGKRLKTDVTEESGNSLDEGPKTPNGPDGDSKRKHVPVTVVPTDPDALRQALKAQIEYYFSDENMRQDEFFQKKIAEDKEGWLEIPLLLSCRMIKRLQIVSSDAVIAALAGSHLETKTDENNKYWIRRTTPLPTLDLSARRFRNKNKDQVADMSTYHDAGCIMKAVGCPEEAGWQAVKTGLQAKLPENARLRFVSQLQQDCSCYAYVRKFEGDLDFLKDEIDLDVNGAQVKVTLLTDATEGFKVLKGVFPPIINQQREKLMRQLHPNTPKKNERRRNAPSAGKSNNKGKPIFIAETLFESCAHLRHCIRDVLSKTIPKEILSRDSKSFKVIMELLKYHPKKEEKCHNVVDIKVDNVIRSGKSTKAFHLIRDSGETDDFSVLKCLDELEKNPPFKSLEATPSGTAVGNVGSVDEMTPDVAKGSLDNDEQNIVTKEEGTLSKVITPTVSETSTSDSVIDDSAVTV